MVMSFKFRMGQYRDETHRKDAPDFTYHQFLPPNSLYEIVNLQQFIVRSLLKSIMNYDFIEMVLYWTEQLIIDVLIVLIYIYKNQKRYKSLWKLLICVPDNPSQRTKGFTLKKIPVDYPGRLPEIIQTVNHTWKCWIMIRTTQFCYDYEIWK